MAAVCLSFFCRGQNRVLIDSQELTLRKTAPRKKQISLRSVTFLNAELVIYARVVASSFSLRHS